MKRAALVAFIVLVFLGILGAILLKTFSSPSAPPSTQAPSPLPTAPTVSATAATESPDSVAATCYSWYVRAYAADTKKLSSEEFKTGALRCFTPEFLAQWASIAAKTDSDPVLLAQDYAQSWITSLTTKLVQKDASQAIVLVTLGTGSETVKFSVTVTETSAGWRISSITRAS